MRTAAKTQRYFKKKGFEPLSKKDGQDVAFILEYCDTSGVGGSTERRKQLFYKRLTRDMEIRCNGWTLTKPLFIHESWATGSFYGVGHNNIMNREAYCHRKGNTNSNPKI